MHSFWKGAVSFGLVSIPVRAYSAIDSDAKSRFHYVHKKDKSPIRFARICKEEGVEVPYSELERAVEDDSGNLVVVAKKELEKAKADRSDALDILHFADLGDIDPRLFDSLYYLEPEKGGAKPYALLRKTLEESGRVGICRYAFRHREALGMIRAQGKALVLHELRYHDELRDPADLALPDEKLVSKKEIDMALELVSRLTERFQPDKYDDAYEKSLRQAIARSTGGSTRKKGRRDGAEIHDILVALQKSLDSGKGTKASRKSAPKTAKRAGAKVIPMRRAKAA